MSGHLRSLYSSINDGFVKRLFCFLNSSGKNHLTGEAVRSVSGPNIPDEPVAGTVPPSDDVSFPLTGATWRAPVEPHRVRVDIIVHMHGKLDVVKECLEALLEFTHLPYSFILVDDGSSDETRKYLVDLALAEGTMLLRNDVPKGFAQTADLGLRHCNADYVVLLDSEVRVGPEWLERMVACAESDERIGLVGPISNHDARQPFFQSVKGQTAGSAPPEVAKSINTESTLASLRIYPRLASLNGFCLMIKRAVINQVSYLDSAVQGGSVAGNSDYSVRAAKAGWELALADDVHVYYKPS